MSENNYGALMMKSALSASINIDEILLPGIYPIPPNNLTSPDLNGGILTVHSGDVKLRTFTSDSIILAISTYNHSSLSWGNWYYPVSHKQLSSHENGLGSHLVGLEGSGTVYDALTRVNILRFGADRTGKTDSSAASRKARNFAVARGINELYFPAGWDYVCADYIEDIYLPGDDGTVNPAWVGVNGDVNIAPELQYK